MSEERQMPKMPRMSKVSKMAFNLWAEPALPYWLRNERSFTIFIYLVSVIIPILDVGWALPTIRSGGYADPAYL